MILVSYCFYMEVKKMRHIASYKNLIINVKKFDEYKEYLFTYFHKEIKSSVNILNYDNIRQYLSTNNLNIKIDQGKGCIRYDTATDKIVLETYYDNDYYRQDFYEYTVVLDRIKYTHLCTTYVKGRIE